MSLSLTKLIDRPPGFRPPFFPPAGLSPLPGSTSPATPLPPTFIPQPGSTPQPPSASSASVALPPVRGVSIQPAKDGVMWPDMDASPVCPLADAIES